VAVLLTSAIVAISTLPWIWMSITEFNAFAWGLFGFEFVVLLGCLATILVCLGKIRVELNLPLAIACLIGTILVGAVFGIHVDARAIVGDNPSIAPWINRTLYFRIMIIALLSLMAVLDVYRRDARSWGLILRAALFLAPVFVLIGWIKLKGMPGVASPSGDLSPTRMVILLLSGLLVGILLSIGGHFLIRSFEISLPESEPDQPGKKPV